MLIIWFQFAIALLLILYAGSRVSVYGDVIAEKSGLGRLWIGFVVLAIITSLPEFANSISAVTLLKVPDLSVSNIFGACLINILIIGLLDVYHSFKGKGSILQAAARGNVMSSGLGLILMSLAAFAIFVSQNGSDISFFGISIFSVIMLSVFLIGNHMIFNYEKNQQKKLKEKGISDLDYEHISKTEAYSKMLLFALIVIAVGAYLPYLGEKIAFSMGLQRTFVGSFFLAIATTMPELVVSFAALRLGAIDMAVGNLLGSYAFNISIIPIADIFYRKGSIFSHVSINNVQTAFIALFLIGIAIIGIGLKPKKRLFGVFGWESLAIICIYFLWLYSVI